MKIDFFYRKISAEARLAASLKRSSQSQPPVKHTATSKMREEKIKNAGVVALKQPLKTVIHNGIPIFLHNKLQKNDPLKAETEPKKPLPPVSANSVHIKV